MDNQEIAQRIITLDALSRQFLNCWGLSDELLNALANECIQYADQQSDKYRKALEEIRTMVNNTIKYQPPIIKSILNIINETLEG